MKQSIDALLATKHNELHALHRHVFPAGRQWLEPEPKNITAAAQAGTAATNAARAEEDAEAYVQEVGQRCRAAYGNVWILLPDPAKKFEDVALDVLRGALITVSYRRLHSIANNALWSSDCVILTSADLRSLPDDSYAKYGEAAKDLVQDVFCKLPPTIKGFYAIKRVQPWLIRVTKNLANDVNDKDATQRKYLPRATSRASRDADSDEQDPVDRVADSQANLDRGMREGRHAEAEARTRQRLADALNSLDPLHRTVIGLRYVGALTQDAVKQALDLRNRDEVRKLEKEALTQLKVAFLEEADDLGTLLDRLDDLDTFFHETPE